jgi:hypothetical protein
MDVIVATDGVTMPAARSPTGGADASTALARPPRAPTGPDLSMEDDNNHLGGEQAAFHDPIFHDVILR